MAQTLEERRAVDRARYAANPEKRKARVRVWRAEHREKHRAHAKAYRLAHPEKVRAAKAAYAKANPDRMRAAQERFKAAHPDKVSAIQKRYAQANPEKRCAISARYRAAHPDKVRTYATTHPEMRYAIEARRRAQKKQAPQNDFTAAQWKEMQAAYDHRCAYCGKRAKNHLTQDHLTPLSKGGSHTTANIIPACRNCNSKKFIGAPLCSVQPLLLTISPPKRKNGKQ